jgi:hypothetical protein
MRLLILACALSASPLALPAQQPSAPTDAPPTAAAIMARVAANQDKAEAARTHYIYVQHARTASRKGKTIRCEETTDYRVTPTTAGSQQQLLKLDGRLLKKGVYTTYTALPSDKNDKNDDDYNVSADDNGLMDQDLVENMRKNLTNGKSKDGISPNLFPLTSKEQATYDFHLLGRAPMNGRDCFHIAFSPNDKNEFGWKGDAYIDATAYQPVLIRTVLSRKVPLAVRMLLGTNVPGLGFTVVYAPQPPNHSDAVWFPTTFGTEFKLRVLFFINRQITFSADNRDFEKTHVSSQIVETPTNPVDPSARPNQP